MYADKRRCLNISKEKIYIFDIFIDGKMALQVKQQYNNKNANIVEVVKYITDDEMKIIDKKITNKFGKRFNELLSNS